MAAITKLKQQLTEQHPGQVGYRELRGVGVFNSTDASGTLDVTPLTLIDSVELTPAAQNASDETLCSTGVSTDGLLRPTSGNITIARTGASKTSALKFFYRVTGR